MDTSLAETCAGEEAASRWLLHDDFQRLNPGKCLLFRDLDRSVWQLAALSMPSERRD